MPNRTGHTTIEMDHRSRSRSPGYHESPNAHTRLLDPRPNSRGSSPNNDWRHHQPGAAPNIYHNNTSLVPLHNTGDKPSLSNSMTNIDHNGDRNRRDIFNNGDDHGPSDKSQPLLEKDILNPPKPPLAGPEIDDLDEESDIPLTAEGHPGVDDGFFDHGNGLHPDIHTRFGEDGKAEGTDGDKVNKNDEKPASEKPSTEIDIEKAWHDINGGDEHDGYVPKGEPGTRSVTPFPYAPDHTPGMDPPIITPDVNVYQQKKNLAQGMMDLALLSANANQLRYVLEAGDYHPYYYASLIFISMSLILQILVGVGLILNSRYDVKEHDDICKADRINDFTVIGIFLITVVNVFIASFGVAQLPSPST